MAAAQVPAAQIFFLDRRGGPERETDKEKRGAGGGAVPRLARHGEERVTKRRGSASKLLARNTQRLAGTQHGWGPFRIRPAVCVCLCAVLCGAVRRRATATSEWLPARRRHLRSRLSRMLMFLFFSFSSFFCSSCQPCHPCCSFVTHGPLPPPSWAALPVYSLLLVLVFWLLVCHTQHMGSKIVVCGATVPLTQA